MSAASREDLAREVTELAERYAAMTSLADRLERETREAVSERDRAKINLKLAVRALRDFAPTAPVPSNSEETKP